MESVNFMGSFSSAESSEMHGQPQRKPNLIIETNRISISFYIGIQGVNLKVKKKEKERSSELYRGYE